MPKVSAVSAELRKLADHLDKYGDALIPQPFIIFHAEDKDTFQQIARALPKPLKKGIDFANTSYSDFTVTYRNDDIHIYAKIPQSMACKLVTPAKPAVYECEPVLSDEEFAEMGS